MPDCGLHAGIHATQPSGMTPFYARVRVTWRPRDPVFSVNFQVASGRAARMGDASLKSCEILKAVKAAHLYSSLFGENAVKRDGGAAKRERGPARDQIYQFGSVEALSTICTLCYRESFKLILISQFDFLEYHFRGVRTERSRPSTQASLSKWRNSSRNPLLPRTHPHSGAPPRRLSSSLL